MADNKIIKFNNSNVYMASFDDLDDFLFYVRDEKVNPMFLNNMASLRNGYNFTGTHSYKEAWNLCRYTMDEGFSQFADKFNTLNYYIDSQEKREDVYSVAGYTPSVQRFLLNIPTSMNSYHYIQDNPTINIYMNYSYSGSTSKKAVEHRGIIVLSLIRYLEKKGYNVNFYGFDLSHNSSYSETLFFEISMKKEYEKLNLKTLYFPLVHPSFLRRLLFRAEEKMPLSSREWVDGYGIPSTYQETIDFLEYYQKLFDSDKIIFISSPSELGISGNDLKEDYHNAINILNNKYQINDYQKTKRRSYYG